MLGKEGGSFAPQELAHSLGIVRHLTEAYSVEQSGAPARCIER
jgi:hypothetical protein